MPQLSDGAGTEGSILDRFPEKQRKKLLEGKSVYKYVVHEEQNGSEGGYGKAFVLINAPVDQCFILFSELEKHYLFFPRIKTTRVVVRDEIHPVVYKEIDAYVTTVKYNIVFTIDPDDHRLDFKLDTTRPNDVRDSAGYFYFEKVDENRTLFHYGLTKTEVKVNVPRFLKKYLVSRDLPKVTSNVKNWIESEGSWKK